LLAVMKMTGIRSKPSSWSRRATAKPDHGGQAHVQQDQIGRTVTAAWRPLKPSGALKHFIASRLEANRQSGDNVRVIIHYQYLFS